MRFTPLTPQQAALLADIISEGTAPVQPTPDTLDDMEAAFARGYLAGLARGEAHGRAMETVERVKGSEAARAMASRPPMAAS